MIDREKVINALMCWRDAAAFQKWTGDCDSCAFAKSKTGDCIDIAPIIDGAIDLLKADQTYLLDKDEKIKKLHLLLNAKLSLADQTREKMEDEIARLNRELDAMNRLSEMQMEATPWITTNEN